MKKAKRLAIIVCAIAMLMSILAIPASAATQDHYPLIYMDKEKEIDRNMPYKIAVTKYPSRKYIQFG